VDVTSGEGRVVHATIVGVDDDDACARLLRDAEVGTELPALRERVRDRAGHGDGERGARPRLTGRVRLRQLETVELVFTVLHEEVVSGENLHAERGRDRGLARPRQAAHDEEDGGERGHAEVSEGECVRGPPSPHHDYTIGKIVFRDFLRGARPFIGANRLGANTQVSTCQGDFIGAKSRWVWTSIGAYLLEQ